ncbi:MAG TPA: YSC84-related protein [Planctomycetota bacterium]|nr:YSC84-related protein [Planctomycetota bacterium]
MRFRSRFVPLAAASLLCVACASPAGDTVDSKRESALRMEADGLAALNRYSLAARDVVASAPGGYAVFSNFGAQILFIGGSGGYGVVRDAKDGKRTYMQMGGGALGLGLGAKDYYLVFAFHDRDVMQKFIDGAWEFNARADAAAKIGDTGGASSGAASFRKPVDVWQITEGGLMLGITLDGVTFKKDPELN